VRYRRAYAIPLRRRTTKKESQRSPQPAVALEERIEEIIDRMQQADDNQVELVAALEEYLTLAYTHEGERWFNAGPGAGTLPTAISRSGGSMTRSARSATRPAVATPRCCAS
jgi:hypothetical protein